MSYRSTTIAQVVERLNSTHFLPAIQRPYVWDAEQIIALFDSLMKGYPISSFLFWEIKPENRDNWEIYKFREHYRADDNTNDLVEPNGRDVTLVLDGQQRLTSLFIGLRGTYTSKLKNKRWDNPSAWVRQRLFIDLLKEPSSETDEDTEETEAMYGFKFSTDELRPNAHQLWLKVGQILDFDDEDAFDRFKDQVIEKLPGDATRDQEKIVRRNLERLYRVIWKDEAISYYTEKNQSYDRVLDIFIRANNGGTTLSKSDLLFSMIVSKWDGVSAREEIGNFIEYINNGLSRKNNFSKYLVMRACLLLSDLDHRYKVVNFSKFNLSLIESNWPKIKSAIESTVRLVNRFGIDRDTLTSMNSLLPIAYYLFKFGRGGLDGSTAFEISNSERVRRWLLGSLLNNVFGGNSDSTIGSARTILRNSLHLSPDYPQHALSSGLARRGRVVTFDDSNTSALLETKYGDRTVFLALSLLYDDQNWGSAIYHVDHIVPQSLASRNELMRRNHPESQIQKILGSVNRIGNLQLLLGRENIEKSNIPFDQWIKSRDAAFLDRHLIPKDPDLWTLERLPEFISARERLIRKRISEISLDSSLPSDFSSEGMPRGKSVAAAAI